MDIDSQPPSPLPPIDSQQPPHSFPSLSEIREKKFVYMVVKLRREDIRYAVYRIDISGITFFSRSNSQPPSISLLDEPLLLLGSQFPPGMVFFSFGSRIYMLGSSSGGIKNRCRSVHIFDTVTCDFGSAAYEQQMLTEKYRPVVIQPLKPFDDRVFVFSGNSCGEDLEVFYPDLQNNSWTFIGGHPSCTFPPGCLVYSHSTVSEGFVLLTTNNVVLLYNIPSGTWTVVEDQSYTTCLFLKPRVFAYEIAKWFSFCVSFPVGDCFLCSYFVDDSKGGVHDFGKSPHLYLPHGPPCQFQELDYLIYLGNLFFCVVRSGYDRPARRRNHSSDPVPKHHVTVTLLRIDPSASSILEERSSSYNIVSLDPQDDTDNAFVCACFVI